MPSNAGRRRSLRVALYDYGTGNLHSLRKAIETAGHEAVIEPSPATALRAGALILPGVGAFGDAAAQLAPFAAELRAALHDGFPCLGICLGMQLLFETSEEGVGSGLGVLPGRSRRLEASRVPHMGWNAVEPVGRNAPGPADPVRRNAPGPAQPARQNAPGPAEPARQNANAPADPLFEGGGLFGYFANSYIVDPADSSCVIAWTEYEGKRFPSAVRRGRTWGVQFHPEKSDLEGLRIVRNFLALAAAPAKADR